LDIVAIADLVRETGGCGSGQSDELEDDEVVKVAGDNRTSSARFR
jgi:hypothetical protein